MVRVIRSVWLSDAGRNQTGLNFYVVRPAYPPDQFPVIIFDTVSELRLATQMLFPSTILPPSRNSTNAHHMSAPGIICAAPMVALKDDVVIAYSMLFARTIETVLRSTVPCSSSRTGAVAVSQAC